jgi:peroxiredoxin
MKRSVTLVALALSFALAGWGGQIPRPAPPLTVPTPSGQKIDLADYKGKVVLVKFFLTDCPHCQRSAGIIMPVYKEWKSRGLEVIGISINPDAKVGIPEFARRFGVTFPMGMGDRLTLTNFADLSAVARFSVPYMFLVDRKGMIRFEHPGGDQPFYGNEAQNLRSEVDALLKEPVPASAAPRKTTTRKAPPKS